VFPVEAPKQPLFSQDIIVQTASLPRWQPEVSVSPRAIPDDDE
jgi:hypothetical protein